MTDRIELRGVRAFGRHGVYDFERAEGQEFVADIVLHLDLAPAGRSDDVGDTVHYGELAEKVTAIIAGDPVDLIETLAGRIADAALGYDLVERVVVTVHKPQAPITVPFGDVAVVVDRSAQHPAVVALGSNLGDRRASLASAVAAIARLDGVALVAVSPVVESAALTLDGVDPNLPTYLNQVVTLTTSRTPLGLLAALQQIELDHGRIRDRRWGDRTLDLDIVSFDGLERQDEKLTLPHPGAASRSFVLVPWSIADPDAVLPGHGRVADLAEPMRHEVRVEGGR